MRLLVALSSETFHAGVNTPLALRRSQRSADQGNFSPTQRPLNECREKTDGERKREKREGANALLLLMDVVVRGWHGGTKCLRESRLVKTQMNVREKTIASSYFSRSPSSFFSFLFFCSFASFYQQTGHTTCSRLTSQILPRGEWDSDQSLSSLLVPRLSPSSLRMPLLCLFSVSQIADRYHRAPPRTNSGKPRILLHARLQCS